MNATTAFTAYESVRDRLPAVRADAPPPEHAKSLADIADTFDTFLLDAFGVLNIGMTAIPGVAERIADLRAMGKRVLVVSNAAGMPHADLLAKYARLGYGFDAADVITSRHALLAGVADMPDLRWGVMANRVAGGGNLEHLDLIWLENDPAAYNAAEGFLMIGTSTWTETRQTLLERALADRPRPVLVGNPDIVAPQENGFSLEPGHFAHRLTDATGVVPRFFGKPFANIFDLAFARLGPNVDRARCVMVGDSLHTDILGAHAAGIGSALIAGYGFFAGHDADAAIHRSGIRPDFVLDRP